MYDDDCGLEPMGAGHSRPPTLHESLRGWMLHVFDSRSVDDGNDYIERVITAAIRIHNGWPVDNPNAVVELYRLGAMQDKYRRAEIIDCWDYVAESLS